MAAFDHDRGVTGECGEAGLGRTPAVHTEARPLATPPTDTDEGHVADCPRVRTWRMTREAETQGDGLESC